MVRAEVEKPTRIEGGFVLVPVAELMGAWRACRSAPLGVGDFRAWLAMREMVARRCHVHRDRDRSPAYGPDELARLMGVSDRRAKSSIRRLEAAGMVGWSGSAILFADQILRDGDPAGDTIGRGRGSVAIPRRLLRHLAAGARGVAIATALGVLLRCLSRRKDGWDGRGRVKASWVAGTFGISARQAKAARSEFIRMGWLEPEDSDPWSQNRWGRPYRVDLGWSAPADDPMTSRRGGGPAPPGDGAISSPLPAESGPVSSPPDLQTRTPSGKEENQEPAGRGPSGVEVTGRGGFGGTAPETPRSGCPLPTSPVVMSPEGSPPAPVRPNPPAPATTVPRVGMAATPPTPRLDDVRVEDLRDVGRTLQLHGQAVSRKLADPSEAGRLRFVALAEHARAVGTTNPAGLFASLLRAGRWSYITLPDEDAARRRIRDHLHGAGAIDQRRPLDANPVATNSGATTPYRGKASRFGGESTDAGLLSEDARVVRQIRASAIRAGLYRDPFPMVQARDAGWTRERWDSALRELGLA